MFGKLKFKIMEFKAITGDTRYIECLNERVNKAIEEGFSVVSSQTVAATGFTKHERHAEIVIFMERPKVI